MRSPLFLFLTLALPVFASPVCRLDSAAVVDNLRLTQNRIAIRNGGGLFKKGVCWWHSRLQRSSAYLAEFRPSDRPPTKREAVAILRHLMWMDKVVRIGGFRDFESFTGAFPEETQALLDSWQRIDGFFNFVWIRGISGNYQLDPEAMALRMKTIREDFARSPKPLWIMAQIKGITAHSFLLLDVIPTADGMELEVIDSNTPSETHWLVYRSGDQSVSSPRLSYTFIPYTGFQKDFNKIHRTVNAHCGRKSGAEIPPGDVELPGFYLQY